MQKPFAMSGEQGRSSSSEMVIHELAVRWMVCFLDVNGELKDKTYYLGFDNDSRDLQEPPEEMLNHFGDLKVDIKPISEFSPRYSSPGTLGPQPRLVSGIRWNSDTEAMVNCSAYGTPLGGFLLSARVSWRSGSWSLVEPISLGIP
jgi:hypothetical protein